MKRRSIDLRRSGPPIGPGANRADIHPESESELRDEVQRDSQLYKQRKVKRRSIDLRRSGPPIGPGASRADIHPELTMEKIQNPPDGRRGVLTSFGSRLKTKRFR